MAEKILEREQKVAKKGYMERKGKILQKSELERLKKRVARQIKEEIIVRDRDVQLQKDFKNPSLKLSNGGITVIIPLGRENRKERNMIAKSRCGNEQRK